MLARLIAAVVVRPVTTTMITVAVILFGIVAAGRMSVDLLPDLAYPSITVRTTYPDAAPVEVEELVTRPVEELVGAVPGIVSVESVSREGQSEVVMDFAWGTNVDRAMADVREKLDRARLPIDAERPQVLRFDPSQAPILRLALVDGEGNTNKPDAMARLRFVAERQLERELEKIPGVAAVVLHGGDEEEVRVELDPTRLAAFGVEAQAVVDAINRDNVNRPGGGLTEGDSRYLIRTVHEARSPEQLAAIVVRNNGSAVLRVGDLARVQRMPIERTESSWVGTRPAVELSVFREGDANTVSVARAVTETLEHLNFAGGREVVVLYDQAIFIESAVDEVRDAGVIGGGLAVLVLLFFLRQLRSTLVIGVAIPISVLAAFVPLKSLGVTLNLMSLGGIALGIGMLVDNSIVVLEAIARRREVDPQAGRAETAIAGTQEIASAVVASTLTTVAVFLPMAFVTGVAGQLVRDLAYAVSFSILSSMFVSLTVVPALEGLGDHVEAPDADVKRSVAYWPMLALGGVWRAIRAVAGLLGRLLSALAAVPWALYERIESLYTPLLRGALAARWLVLAGALGLVTASVGVASTLDRALLPELTQDSFFVQLSLPQGSPLEATERALLGASRAVMGDPKLATSFARAGSISQAGSAAGNVEGTHLGQLDLRLSPTLEPQQRASARAALLEKLRAVDLPTGTRFVVGEPTLIAFDAPLEVQVFAERPEDAVTMVADLLPALAQIDTLEDLAPDDLLGRPELRLEFDRERLSQLDLTVDAVASAVQRAVQGELAGKMQTPEDQLDIRVQLPRVARSEIRDVEQIQVAVKDGVPVPLSAVAQVHPTTGPAEIRRLEGRRGLRITARVTSPDLDGVAQQVEAAIAQHARPDPRRGEARVSGQAAAIGESLLGLALTAALSVFLVYVVMASSFESLHHPFLIIFTVPLAAVGVIWACVLVGLPLSALVGIGTIILGGIVVNNAIVLVNAINQRRGAGVSTREAILQAGQVRLRPILMTTATTALGLLPMALGLGEGAALRQPLAVAVIGGLLAATALTLVVIPCAYAIVPGRRREAWSTGAELVADPASSPRETPAP